MKLRMTKQSLNDPVVFRLIVAKNDSKNNGIDIKTTLIQFVGTWWSIYFNWGAVSFSLRITKYYTVVSQFVAVHELLLSRSRSNVVSLYTSLDVGAFQTFTKRTDPTRESIRFKHVGFQTTNLRIQSVPWQPTISQTFFNHIGSWKRSTIRATPCTLFTNEPRRRSFRNFCRGHWAKLSHRYTLRRDCRLSIDGQTARRHSQSNGSIRERRWKRRRQQSPQLAAVRIAVDCTTAGTLWWRLTGYMYRCNTKVHVMYPGYECMSWMSVHIISWCTTIDYSRGVQVHRYCSVHAGHTGVAHRCAHTYIHTYIHVCVYMYSILPRP